MPSKPCPPSCTCGKHKPTQSASTYSIERRARIAARNKRIADGQREVRFWARVDRRGPDGCWPWLGKLDKGGYGRVKVSGYQASAPRYAFFLDRGRWPQVSRHTCDNPACCNPAHIIDGTLADNNRDMVERGRQRAPVNRHWPRLKRNAKGQFAGL